MLVVPVALSLTSPPTNESVAEFTWKAIILGSIFGVLFGASTVYLALKAGLTVSAVDSNRRAGITIGKRFLAQRSLRTTLFKPAVLLAKA